MINLERDHLMFIEPSSKSTEPRVFDKYTVIAECALGGANPGPERWRGVHKCACGERSDNRAWRTRGFLTNSLLVHYVANHRSEVPESELAKLLEWDRRNPKEWA